MDLTQVLATAGDSVFTIIFFVIALSIIVAIHEYGHYIVGRWTGIKAEVFSLGFGPVLYSRFDKHGTKWQIAAVPLGGYVKFLGDKNAASVGSEDVDDNVNPRNTMTHAPLWARALTVAAGPVANFILAIAIFAGLILWQGRVGDDWVVASEFATPPNYQSELQVGDQILQIEHILIDGITDENSPRIDDLPRSETKTYTVLRDGERLEVEGPNPIIPRITALMPRSAADDADLKIDDFIVGIDGEEVFAFGDIVEAVKAADGDSLMLDVWRDGETLSVELSPRRVDRPLEEGGFETRWLIGIQGEMFFVPMTEPVGVWDATTLAWDRFTFTIKSSLSALWHIVVGEISTCNLSGPVAIAQASGSMAAQGADSFIVLIASLSAGIGLINLFPIPVLDGGHLVFHAYEAVTRRKPTERAFNYLMFAGLFVVLSFMMFSLLNDLVLCP